MLCGGHSASNPPDDTINNVVNQVKADLLQRFNTTSGVSAKDVSVVSYTTQVVAGTNYAVTLHLHDEVGGPAYRSLYKAVIFQALPCHGGKLSVTSTDAL